MSERHDGSRRPPREKRLHVGAASSDMVRVVEGGRIVVGDDADPTSTTTAAAQAAAAAGDAAGGDAAGDASALSWSAVEATLSPLTILLNGLTASERERVVYDLHGVADVPDEDPTQMEEWMEEMWTRHIPAEARDHPGLALAVQTDPQYVRTERLKFLRAEGDHSSSAASARMGHYFDLKLRYFGDESGRCGCIARDLTLREDFSEDELEHIKTGFFQLCEERDRSGRIVTMMFPQPILRWNIPARTVAKFSMYGAQILTRDESVQRVGKVHIGWALGLWEDDSLRGALHDAVSNAEVRDTIQLCDRYLPLRCVAKHICLDSPSMQDLLQLWCTPMASFNFARVRAHYGSPTECMYELMTMGISAESLPLIGDDGEVDIDFHLGILEALKRLEEGARLERASDVGAGTTSLSVQQHLVFPGPMDVIMGKGVHNRKNPGNLRFKMVLEENYDEYEHATIVQRKKIVDTILEKVKDKGSRFLYLSDGSSQGRHLRPLTTANDTTAHSQESTPHQWIEASTEKARDKVTHDFRNLRRAEKSQGSKREKREL